MHMKESMLLIFQSGLFHSVISSCIHFLKNVMISFSLQLHNIPLCVCTILSLPTHWDGHLGWFHFLAIVNTTVINRDVPIFILVVL